MSKAPITDIRVIQYYVDDGFGLGHCSLALFARRLHHGSEVVNGCRDQDAAD